MTFKKKYTFDKLPRAMSYRQYLLQEIEKAKLRGAKVELKEYKARLPKALQDTYEMSNKDLKELDSTMVTLQSAGKIIAHTLLTNEFWYGTIKVSERDETDDMKLSAYSNFITPMETQIDARA